jgi:hypothetical protein
MSANRDTLKTELYIDELIKKNVTSGSQQPNLTFPLGAVY